MYFFILLPIVIMAGFLSDNDKYFLAGLTHEGHEVDVTMISDSENNYTCLLECARLLSGGEKDNNFNSDVAEPGSVKLGVKQASVNFQESELSGSTWVTSSRASYEQLVDVS